MATANSTGYKMSFRHFSLLRKAIVTKQSGMIRFRTTDDYSGMLLLSDGEIGCDDGYQQLIRFLSSPMVMTEWKEGQVQTETSPALEAITYAVNHLDWPDNELRAVSVMFSRLPHVKARLLDVHFDSFLTDISYNLFYQQSLSIEGFTPAYFLLDNDPGNSLLLHRVRVLTFNYLLGLMHAATPAREKIPEAKVKKTRKLGFISRIMHRIRAIGG